MKDSVINKRQYSLIAIPAAYLICAVSMFLPLLKLGNFSISMIDLRTGLNSVSLLSDFTDEISVPSEVITAVNVILALTFIMCLTGTLALFLLKNKWAYGVNLFTSAVILSVYVSLIVAAAKAMNTAFHSLSSLDVIDALEFVDIGGSGTMMQILIAFSGYGLWLILAASLAVAVISIAETVHHAKRSAAASDISSGYSQENIIYTPPAPEYIPPIPARKPEEPVLATVMGLRGPCRGEVYEIRGTQLYIMGRDPKFASIVIRDANISRRHCAIKFNQQTDTFSVIDYSINGVFDASGNRITPNVYTEFPRGSEISLGNQNNVFLLK